MKIGKRDKVLISILSVAIIGYSGCQSEPTEKEELEEEYPEEVTVEMISDTDGYSYICRPAGKGTFPAVLYSHGGLGTAIGGDLEGTCMALAEAGYLARAEKRDTTISLAGHLNEVLNSLDELLAHEDANTDKIGIMGFSRGGLLTLQAGITKNDRVHAILLLSPAPGAYDADSLTTLHTTLEQASEINAPVLVLVPENDLYQANHVQLGYDVRDSLTVAEKDVSFILYPAYDADGDGITFYDFGLDGDDGTNDAGEGNGEKDEGEIFDEGDDGHELFWEVQEPYWSDVLQFLDTNL
jgi:dienelactone hydrolase